MSRDLSLVVVAVIVSVVLVPLGLGIALPTVARTGTQTELLGIGVVAMTPGFLMGGIGLWLSARG